MNDIANRTLLLASFCVTAINMAIEVLGHPTAADHVGSITGLIFCLTILLALVLRRPPQLVTLAVVLNVLIATVSVSIICRYLFIYGAGWDAAKELLVKTYFVIVVPIFAVRYFILDARTSRSLQPVTPNQRLERP